MKAVITIASACMLSLLATSCSKPPVETTHRSYVVKPNSGMTALLKGWGTRVAFEAGMRELAGPTAINCGRIPVRADRKPAVQCVLAANRLKKPLWVVFEEQGVDSEVETAIVRTPAGDVTSFSFDGSFALSTSSSCPAPLRLQLMKAGQVTCD